MTIRGKSSTFLTAAIILVGLAGCTGIAVVGHDPVPLPPVLPQADAIIVTYTGVGSAIVDNASVVAFGGSAVVKEFVIPAGSGASYVDTLKGLNSGITYKIVVTKAGYWQAVQSIVLSGSVPPNLGVAISQVETDANTTVIAPVTVVTDPIVVAAPSSTTSDFPNLTTDPGVTLSQETVNVTGTVSLASTTPSNLSGDPTTSTLSGLQIDFEGVTDATALANSTVEVTMVIPLSTEDLALAAGSTVNIVKFDPNTLTWSQVGTATISADGTATGTVTGLTSSNTLAVETPTTLEATTSTEISETIVKSSTIRGALDEDRYYTSSLNPTISAERLSSAKIAAGAAGLKITRIDSDYQATGGIISGPAGIPASHWQIIVPIIPQNLPEMRSHLYGGHATASVYVPPDITVQIVRTLTSIQSDISIQIGVMAAGTAIFVTYRITIEFGRIVLEWVHESGNFAIG